MRDDFLPVVVASVTWAAAGFFFCLAVSASEEPKYSGPAGVVTDKLWVDDYWEGSEQLYPERFCLELNHREEVCIPEGYWKTITVGDWYGVKK